MNVLIIDNGTKHLGKLKSLLSDNNIEVRKLFGKYDDLKSNDIVILSGGSQLAVNSAPEIFRQEIKLLKTSQKPVIGICEGCELIAYAFKSKMEFYSKKAKGLKRIKTLQKNNLFKGIDNLKVYEAHHWAIKELGPELRGLAKSDRGYEIIKHKTRKIYGLQFHPEMVVGNSAGDIIFRRIFIKLAGRKKQVID